MYVQGDETRVVRLLVERAEAPVHGQALAAARTEVDVEAAVERPVVGDVVFQDPVEGLPLEAGQVGAGPAGRIAAHVPVAYEVRGRGEQDRRLRRVGHGESVPVAPDRPVRLDPGDGDALQDAVPHGDGQRLRGSLGLQALGRVGRIEAHPEGQRLPLIGGQPDDDDPVRMTGEHLPRERRPVHRIADFAEGPPDVQSPLVIGEHLVPGEVDREISEGLIGHLAEGDAHEPVHGQRFRLAGFAGEQELPDRP